MAHKAANTTPMRKEHLGFKSGGMNSASRNATLDINGVNTKTASLKSFLTPHKPSTYREDIDDDGENGGVLLTPQPRRGINSKKTARYENPTGHNEHRGGASLSASRTNTGLSSVFTPETKRDANSVAFAKTCPVEREDKSNDGDDDSASDGGRSSHDGTETVATSNKTMATSEGTQKSSPNTVMSPPATNTITPKANGWTGQDLAQLVQTVPAHFAPSVEPRKGFTDNPPPAFDLTANLSNLVNQVIARAAQSSPSSLKSAGTGYSSGSLNNQAYSPDIFQSKPAGTPVSNASSALVQRGNGYNDVFRSNNSSTPGSTTSPSSLFNKDLFRASTGASPGPVHRKPELHNNIGLQQILEQTREAFPKLVLPALNTQPVLDYGHRPVSDMLNSITMGFTTRPPADLALAPEYEPFIPSSSQVKVSNCAVVKIDDLPYEARVSDIIAFVGGNAKILNDAEEPVHIMMERITAKTGAAYVEFYDFESAVKVVDKHRLSKAHGKPVRINTRIVTVSISSQDALLKDLFPYAREVTWIGGRPIIGVPPEKFKGFVTEEELISLVKNVEFPHRVPYTKACPQRSVETLISIIKKLPWHMAMYITVRQRHRIYKAVMDMMRVLQTAVYDQDRRRQDSAYMSEMLNEKLLKRLVRASVACSGFTPLMKDNIGFIGGLDEYQMADYGLPSHAHRWRHLYALTANPAIPSDVVDYYIALIREETTRMADALPPLLRRQVRARGADTDPYWGYFWAVVGFPEGAAFDDLSLQQCADRELTAIDAVLARALPSSSSSSAASSAPGGGPGLLA